MAFPSSPSNGNTHLEDGISYTYNSTYASWLKSGRIVVTAKANNVGIGLSGNYINLLNGYDYNFRTVITIKFGGA